LSQIERGSSRLCEPAAVRSHQAPARSQTAQPFGFWHPPEGGYQAPAWSPMLRSMSKSQKSVLYIVVDVFIFLRSIAWAMEEVSGKLFSLPEGGRRRRMSAC
jgi:hypothetical protein